MEKNNLFVFSANCGVFFEGSILIDKKEKIDLLSRITDKCGNLLNGEPSMLPLPVDAPPDIPRLQLNSKDNYFAYGISPLRSDFRFNEVGEPHQKIKNVQIDLFKTERELLKIYKEDKKWNIVRLSIVVDFVAELENKVANFISEKFIKNSPSFPSIEVSFLKKEKISNINVNRWFRIKSAGNRESVLHLLADINTFAEEKQNLSVEEMITFYSATIPYIEKEIHSTFEGFLK